MNWTELLRAQMEEAYKISEGLIDLVDEDKFDWKPSEGDNWLTTGQLIQHMTDACGGVVKGFVTGEWPMPEGMDAADMKPEDMLPPADAFPPAASIADVKEKLAADRSMSLTLVGEAGEERLANEDTVAPWDPTPMKLGQRLLGMIGHLNNHKCQLFYYLKMQGKPVNTWHLYGSP